ncbi:MAG: DUF427 domain-containing protein [Rhodospirillales bacterium]|nr:DUF427 domain-containing protein [Rhodospirillales bacterium]MBO6787794.1 DUF427 domain-containing protein [Rhodospirillales bacterium]
MSFSAEPVAVYLGDVAIAESNAAVILHEPGYPDRYYFPRLDVKMDFLAPSDKVTACPHKGPAEYFHIEVKGSHRENLAWSYPAAKLGVAEISGFIAFHNDDPDISIR